MAIERESTAVDTKARRSAEIVDFGAARRRKPQRRRSREGFVAETPDEVRRRTMQNLASAAVVAALVIGGLWLIVHLRQSLKVEECVESGRRNCVTIDTVPSQQN